MRIPSWLSAVLTNCPMTSQKATSFPGSTYTESGCRAGINHETNEPYIVQCLEWRYRTRVCTGAIDKDANRLPGISLESWAERGVPETDGLSNC